MKNKPKSAAGVLIGLLCTLLLSVFCLGFEANAEVYTTNNDSGAADTVYVAGNPDCYPVEYYDPESRTFKGVIPDMLEEISKKTGISFTYISASSKNRQKELARNNQAELLTAFVLEQADYSLSEVLPVLKADASGRERTYCVGFTDIASESLKKTLRAAFDEITDREKNGLLLQNSKKNPELYEKDRLITIVLISFAAFFAAALTAFVILLRKRRHSEGDVRIDELTGIGNSKYYIYAFNQLITRQSKNLYILVYLALASKAVVIKYGEEARDQTDKYAAAHLNAAIASSEYLSRIGSGVFALLLQAPTEKEAESITESIVDSLNRYIAEFYPDIPNAFRAGVSRLCEHLDCNAETALYNAKQGFLAASRSDVPVEIAGKSQLLQSRRQEELRRLAVNAVENDEFRAYMQFIVDAKTEKICGAEVLSRWQSPEYGMLRPCEYIGLLKETGKIVAHDYRMFLHVCRLLEEWSTPPYNRMFITCNFTRLSLCQADFCDVIESIIADYSFDRGRLVIEVTEDSISGDSAAISENISRCRKLGFRIAIDDMGTGFSSFADLYDNETDMVKIGSEFISSCSSERRRRMLSDIITLVRNSGARIVIEGVESREQAELLKEIGCDMMQGYYYSGVLPSAECRKILGPDKLCPEPAI